MSKMSESAIQKELDELQAKKTRIFDGMSQLIAGQTIETVAPVLVVAVARVLVLDAGSDKERTALNVAKFIYRLTDVVNDMLTGDPEGTIH